ncbi:GNAT family N-acetyltransferase [Sphingobacterium deserti]|uniref:GCN5-related N-acetyltransferase n=1 Tax=Sphingobacterium deserti TaxID=1229276 RepID=A0A0B8T5J4_9SPHI|nr:GNAT family N-acetyltransferase [Sphingobacterium deserti]KGE15868.1 GCN5-related N-acetyltransferase [Sphingobacterium deserti]
MEYTFRKATPIDAKAIWTILQNAIERRKADGSAQWQDGYPNPTVVNHDIEKEQGFVLLNGEEIVGYTSILINDEPAYENIEGKWLSDADFVVFHRVAISASQLGKGLSKVMLAEIEKFALTNNIHSVRADTNFDNMAMLKIFDRAGYHYCGEVYFRGSARRAFEKLL